MKKFEFTGETKTISLFFRTATLHRIRAVAEFGLVLSKLVILAVGLRKKKIFPMKERLGFAVMPRFGAMPRFAVMNNE